MDALTFDVAAFGAEFARLVLTAGLAVVVLLLVVRWAIEATKTREDAPDE